MHDQKTVSRALQLLAGGYNQSEVARKLSISTPDNSRLGTRPHSKLRFANIVTMSKRCGENFKGPIQTYLYLLGLYLSDGCLTETPRDVFKLRIACCNDYPVLLHRCCDTMRAVMPDSKVGVVAFPGHSEVSSHSKHWPCLFPQHGPGKKHERAIKLELWQQSLVDLDPRPLVEGLIHSDGCRVTNPIINRKTGKRYEYPRYHFSQKSADIKQIFTDALDQLGIAWRHNNAMMISSARKEGVTALDSFIVPKH